MAILKTEAIVLRTMDYSETSLIAWCFTAEHGRVHVIAKGARRPRSPFEGGLEPLARGELVFYRKTRGGGGDGLEVAREFDLHDLHRGLRQDLQRLNRGVYLGELLTELSEREVPAPEAFAAASAALAALARADPPQLDAHLFSCELRLLNTAGIGPRLDRCVRCGAAPEGQGTWFGPQAGGVLCRTHARTDPSGRQVPLGALRTLAALGAGQRVTVGREVGHEVRATLDLFIAHQLGRPLRAARLLR